MEKWYQLSDFVISTSHYEGAGIAVAEAMSCGCIPILSRIDSFTAMTGNGQCGILFQAGNEEDLLKALRTSVKMDRESASLNALHRFQEQLSFPAISGKIEKLAASLIKRNHIGTLSS
jgi:glycosyltransferase involved in cell wall biosynthesis